MVPTMSAHLLLAELLALPLADRQVILEKLRESIEHPNSIPQSIDDAHFAEVEHRWHEIQTGKAKLVPWDEFEARLLADD